MKNGISHPKKISLPVTFEPQHMTEQRPAKKIFVVIYSFIGCFLVKLHDRFACVKEFDSNSLLYHNYQCGIIEASHSKITFISYCLKKSCRP